MKKENKGITLDWPQKIRQNWTWFNEGDIIKKVKEERKIMSKKVTKKNNKFTPQFRRKVVLEIEDGNKTFSEIVREYDLNESSLCRWLRIYRTEGLEGLAKISKGGRRKDTLYKKRGQELLEKKKYLSQQEEIRLLKMEKEYYKKMVELLTEENLKKKNQTINRKPK